MYFFSTLYSSLDEQHFRIIVGLLQGEILMTLANFNASQCKQTHVHVGKEEKRPEDHFPGCLRDFAILQSSLLWLNLPQCSQGVFPPNFQQFVIIWPGVPQCEQLIGFKGSTLLTKTYIPERCE